MDGRGIKYEPHLKRTLSYAVNLARLGKMNRSHQIHLLCSVLMHREPRGLLSRWLEENVSKGSLKDFCRMVGENCGSQLVALAMREEQAIFPIACREEDFQGYLAPDSLAVLECANQFVQDLRRESLNVGNSLHTLDLFWALARSDAPHIKRLVRLLSINHDDLTAYLRRMRLGSPLN